MKAYITLKYDLVCAELEKNMLVQVNDIISELWKYMYFQVIFMESIYI